MSGIARFGAASRGAGTVALAKDNGVAFDNKDCCCGLIVKITFDLDLMRFICGIDVSFMMITVLKRWFGHVRRIPLGGRTLSAFLSCSFFFDTERGCHKAQNIMNKWRPETLVVTA